VDHLYLPGFLGFGVGGLWKTQLYELEFFCEIHLIRLDSEERGQYWEIKVLWYLREEKAGFECVLSLLMQVATWFLGLVVLIERKKYNKQVLESNIYLAGWGEVF
jgi:hypothetical protein